MTKKQKIQRFLHSIILDNFLKNSLKEKIIKQKNRSQRKSSQNG